MRKFAIIILSLGVLIFFLWKIRTPDVSFSEKIENPSLSVVQHPSQDQQDSLNEEAVPVDVENQFEHYLKQLPTIADLQNLTDEDLHYTPEVIREGGELIGRIHQEAADDPSKRQDALVFFKQCAEDTGVAVPIRAVCLNKVYKLMPEWKIPVTLPKDISEEVHDLAMRL